MLIGNQQISRDAPDMGITTALEHLALDSHWDRRARLPFHQNVGQAAAYGPIPGRHSDACTPRVDMNDPSKADRTDAIASSV